MKNLLKLIVKLFNKVGKIQPLEILRKIDLLEEWKIDLSIEPTLIRRNTTNL